MDENTQDPSGSRKEHTSKSKSPVHSSHTDDEEEKVEEIKSTAVVKYSAPKPAQFTRLQFNTDLNMPPSNWLSSQADPYGLQYGLCQRESFSSFRMAHCFPDLVGEVDVISDAENIKNLLKIPYYKGHHISMMVHRVENTLLLDNFDIHKHLMRDTDKNFRWLREFFMKTVDQETCDRDKARYNKRRKCSALSGRNLKLKFLYRSLVVDNNTSENTNPVPSTSSGGATSNSTNAILINNGNFPEFEPALPEPAFVIPDPAKSDRKITNFTSGDHKNSKSSTTSMPPPVAVPLKGRAPLFEPQSEDAEADPDNQNADNAESDSGPSAGTAADAQQNYYNRSVAWTFEDIEMLIGTDLPIFGGGTHPCISLRLRDMTKPISVLTGIDYWLDNLMCEVPEVLMCYHLNGIVQTYELVKTEDLPRLNGSKFSPKLIRDVAQHILSFLKSNATKAGHTYWLFKGSDEEVVKLYDLTSLCSATDVEEDIGRNPFTIPVAMLLYRVARNMRNGKEQKHRQSGTVRMLLKNCVKLLPAEKYPEIVTSSHYMLSDLYVPSGTNPEKPDFPNSTSADRLGEKVLPKNPNFPRFKGEFEDHDDEEQKQEASLKTLNLDCANLKSKDKSSTKKSNVNGDTQEGDDLRKSPPPVSGTVEERCLQAIDHVADGLSCLKYFPLDSDKTGCQNGGENSGKKPGGHQKWEDEIPMAKSHEPIPMPYSTLNPDKAKEKNMEDSSKLKQQKGAGKKNKHNNKNPRKLQKNSGSGIVDKDKAASEIDVKNNTWITINQAVKKRTVLSVKSSQLLPPTLRADYEKLKIPSDLSWKDHLRTLLYEKAVLVYATLSEHYFVQGCYGNSLRTIGLLARSQLVLGHFPYKSDALKEDCLLGRAGDCCLRIVENWTKVDTYRNQYTTQSEADEKFTKQLNIDERSLKISIGDFNLKCVFLYDILRMEQMLVKAVECYELAQSIWDRSNGKREKEQSQRDDNALGNNNTGSASINRRLGNSYNEMASFYLSKARSSDNFDDVKTFSQQAEMYLNKGIEIFRQMNDNLNVSLMYANIGHMYRVLANSSWRLTTERGRDELGYLSKAVQSYKRALQILGAKTDNCAAIWDATNWDLCTALLSSADALIERPPVGMSDSEREQQVIAYFQQTLQHCDLEDEDNAKFPLYQLRAAIVAGSLAAVYHRQLLRDGSGGGAVSSLANRKRLIQLAKTNYEKCVELSFQTQDVLKYFANQLKRAAVSEHLAETTNTVGSQIKHWQDCLSVLVQTKEMLKLLVDKVVEIPEKEEEKDGASETPTYDDLHKLNKLQKKRLQNVLKMLTKLCSQKPYANKECPKWGKIYKECYRKSFELTEDLSQEDLIVKLYEVLTSIGELTLTISSA